MNVPDFGKNGEVVAFRPFKPDPQPVRPGLNAREGYKLRLALVFLLGGPLNPVGLICATFFVRGGLESFGWVLFAVNLYCSIAALIVIARLADQRQI